MSQKSTPPAIAAHGASCLSSVEVDTFNIELKDNHGFLGDCATKSTFRNILDDWRAPFRGSDDPLGDESSKSISNKELDAALTSENAEAAALIHSAIESFAQELARVVQRFLKTKAWEGTERIAVGGGFRNSRVGELAIARTGIILKSAGLSTELRPIRFHPDEAGLIGAVHLAPSWIFEGHDSVLAVDIGGTKIRCGVIDTQLKKAIDLSKACVWKSDLWRHADDEPNREETVRRLANMLRELIAKAEEKGLKLAPFVGVACPGVIREDGSIERGAQNLPGNWESSRFNLPASLVAAIPEINMHATSIVMHNDAVVQGLSEAPFMQDVQRWGILTIGTGLGNARFTNRGLHGTNNKGQ